MAKKKKKKKDKLSPLLARGHVHMRVTCSRADINMKIREVALEFRRVPEVRDLPLVATVMPEGDGFGVEVGPRAWLIDSLKTLVRHAGLDPRHEREMRALLPPPGDPKLVRVLMSDGTGTEASVYELEIEV